MRSFLQAKFFISHFRNLKYERISRMGSKFNLSTLKRNKYLWKKEDCLELLYDLPDEVIDLVITSPPYGIQKAYEKGNTLVDTLAFQEEVIDECCRVVSKSGSICWQVGSYVSKRELVPLDILVYKIFKKNGFKLRNRIIWTYEHGMHAKHKFSGRYETILWFTKTDDYYFNLDPVRVPQKQPTKKYYKGPKKGQLSCNPLGKNPGDVWRITNIKHAHPEKIDGGHPCQFPLKLVDRCILSMTKPNDIVLDPFGGVATTNISALRNNRYSIGTEIDQDYYELGLKRIKSAKRTLNKIQRQKSSSKEPSAIFDQVL